MRAHVYSPLMITLVLATSPAVTAQCANEWSGHFGLPGLTGVVECFKVFDDGTGPALYVADGPIGANGLPLNSVARWDGNMWSSLPNFGVNEFEVFDDGQGGGPALYAAGRVPQGADVVAKWNGTNWIVLGSASFNGTVTDLAVFDDGSGPRMYAAGQFTSVSGTSARYIAQWNGQTWSALGPGPTNGTDNVIRDLQVHDDGSGDALFVCGSFGSAGGITASRIAKWDGANWINVGNASGVGLEHMTSYIEGTLSSLYVWGNSIGTIDGVAVTNVARRTGTTWSSAGTLNNVFKLGSYEYSGHSELLAGTATGLFVWNGSSWQQKVATDDVVHTFVTFDDGLSSHPALFIGGQFDIVGALHANNIARWNGVAWSNLTQGHGVSGKVNCLAVGAVGTQETALYAAGLIDAAGSVVNVSNVAKWDGMKWSRLKGGVNGEVFAARVLEITPGQPSLYVGGSFQQADGIQASGIARWNGENWSSVGGGLVGGATAFATYDDGTGRALYAAGQFVQAGAVQANNIAKWNGAAWSALGSGTSGPVWTLAEFNDGTGSALYVGGDFGQAGGMPAQIARWNGTTWNSVGTNVIGSIRAMEVFDDGSGSALYVAGFPNSSALFDGAIVKWNGVSWSSVGFDAIGGTTPRIHALSVIDDGNGSALFAAGKFTSISDVNAMWIAKWNGVQWSNLDGGVFGSGNSAFASSVAGYQDVSNSPTSVYVGGVDIVFASSKLSNNIARWGCPYELPAPDCDSDGISDHVAITSGSALDCNGNTIPDSCDLAQGSSLDLNSNGIPDECEPPPVQASTNNTCSTAKLIGSGYTLFSTVGATTDGPNEPDGCAVNGYTHIENDVWFRYVAPCVGTVRLSLCGSVYDAKMAVYLPCPTSSGQMIACSDDFCGTSPRISFVNQTPVTLYRIRIGGHQGATGIGVLHAICFSCPADVDGNAMVNVGDMLAVINAWGSCPSGSALCAADVNGDLFVNVGDLLAVINAWGACR